MSGVSTVFGDSSANSLFFTVTVNVASVPIATFTWSATSCRPATVITTVMLKTFHRLTDTAGHQ